MPRAAATRWLLVAVDPQVRLRLEGWSDAVESSRRPVIGGATALGSAGPVVQWVAGGAHRVSWRARWQAVDVAERLEPVMQTLDRLRERDGLLGRAPRVLVQHPGGVTVTGLVESAEYSVVGWWPNGQVREIVAELAVVAARAVAPEAELGPGRGETLWTVLGEGDTYEALAARQWGDPLRGDLIRRTNPGVVEEAGARVRMLEREHPRMTGPVRPVSPPFARLRDGSWTGRDLVEQLGLERMAGPSVVWERLPEVAAGLV